MEYQKRFLFVSGFYYPSQLGGPCNSNHWLVNALKEKNFYVTVIATDTGIEDGLVKINEWIYDNNGKVIYIRTKRPNFSLNVIFKFFRELKNADFIQISSLFSSSSFLLGITSTFFNKTIIWSPRGELAEPALRSNKRIKQFFIFIIKLFSKKMYFHVTSNEELNDIKLVFGNHVNFILHPNYIKLPKIEIVQRKNQLIYLGRLHPIKALDNLLNALNISNIFKKSDYKFLIVGNGSTEYKNYLRDLVLKLKLENHVCFKDHVNDIKEKNVLFSESKFAFLISNSENFGNVVLESLSNGTPVVASKGTPWENLNEKNAGFWIDNDPLTLSSIIDKIITMDSNSYTFYSENAKVFANEFNIEENIEKWIASYKFIAK